MFKGHEKVSVATRREAVDDLVLMPEVNEKAIVAVLDKRFRELENIYTYIGPVLVSVNPYRRIPGTVGPEVMAYYSGKFYHENVPHIYALAEDTYRTMKGDKESHCVIISGESGAGKTEASKMIMAYVAQASGSGAGVDYVKSVILDSNPLLEAFGNAKTIRNDNSSRFGKYFEIQFDKRGNPCGGNIENYLLEKSRVCNQTEGERNFHIFYLLTNGAPAELLESLQLYEPAHFHYLNQSTCTTVPTIDDAEWFQEMYGAMSTMGVSDHERTVIFQIISGILHFGNVGFVPNKEDNAAIDPNTHSELELAANYFGVEPSILSNAIMYRVITTGGRGGRMSTYNSPQNLEQAASARDALSKDIYSRVFDYLVMKVNGALQANATPSDLVIGILDIFGFEIFEKNGFEQFCINFVNEKLQQYFIELTLKAEQEEYVKEGIAWTPIKYFDNQIVCDLIEGKRPPGIFSLLDDVGATAHAMDAAKVDQKFLEKMSGICSSNKHWQGMTGAFSIKHYAGRVIYEGNGFVERNRDTLFDDLIETMQSSTHQFLVDLFPEDTSGTQKKRPTTAGFKIKNSAAALMNRLSQCSPHYIRCVKPNDNKSSSEFDFKRVQHQVQYLGLLENVKVRRAGFAYRAEFHRFVRRYKKLSPQTWGTWGEWSGDAKQGCVQILSDNNVANTEYQMGKTKIFLKKPETLFFMEEQLERFQHECTVRIQNAWRGFKLRRRALEERAKAADLFRGKKQRQQSSINRKFLADYMNYQENFGMQEAIKQGGGAGEEMVFAANVQKLNRRLKVEKRDFLVTPQALYLVNRRKKGQTLLYKVTARVDIGSIQSVSLSTAQDNVFVVHCQDQDYCMWELNKTECATKLYQYYQQATGRALPLNFQQMITYKIKTGDTRTVTVQVGSGSPDQFTFQKSGKGISVSVAQGLDPNTDTTPSAWKAKLAQLKAGYSGPTQIKSQVPGHRGYQGPQGAAKVESQFDRNIVSPRSQQAQQPARPAVAKRGASPKRGGFKGKKAAKKAGVRRAPQKTGQQRQVPARKATKSKGKGARKGKGKGKGARKGKGKGARKGKGKGKGKGNKKMPPPPPKKQSLPTCTAGYDYQATNDGELSFAAGEVLFVMAKDASGWWEVKNSSGASGWAPGSYLA